LGFLVLSYLQLSSAVPRRHLEFFNAQSFPKWSREIRPTKCNLEELIQLNVAALKDL